MVDAKQVLSGVAEEVNTKEKDVLICGICRKTFHIIEDFIQHKEEHMRKKEDQHFQCCVCSNEGPSVMFRIISNDRKEVDNSRPQRDGLSDAQVSQDIGAEDCGQPSNYRSQSVIVYPAPKKEPVDSDIAKEEPEDSDIDEKEPKDSDIGKMEPKDSDIGKMESEDSDIDWKQPKDSDIGKMKSEDSGIGWKQPKDSDIGEMESDDSDIDELEPKDSEVKIEPNHSGLYLYYEKLSQLFKLCMVDENHIEMQLSDLQNTADEDGRILIMCLQCDQILISHLMHWFTCFMKDK